MKNPIADPKNASEGECRRPATRATLTVEAKPYAKNGTNLLSLNSRDTTRASAQDWIECPDGNASPPRQNEMLVSLVSGLGLCVTAFKILTVISASARASMPMRAVSRERGLSAGLP